MSEGTQARRDMQCARCALATNGDCGEHGPRIIKLGEVPIIGPRIPYIGERETDRYGDHTMCDLAETALRAERDRQAEVIAACERTILAQQIERDRLRGALTDARRRIAFHYANCPTLSGNLTALLNELDAALAAPEATPPNPEHDHEVAMGREPHHTTPPDPREG